MKVPVQLSGSLNGCFFFFSFFFFVFLTLCCAADEDSLVLVLRLSVDLLIYLKPPRFS